MVIWNLGSHNSFPLWCCICSGELGADLPPSALPRDAIDILFERLGGRNCVAEITGRRLRYEVGHGRKRLPSTRSEIDAFQRGEKRVAIISRAGSTGISLHSDDRQSSPRLHLRFWNELVAPHTLCVGWLSFVTIWKRSAVLPHA